MSFVSWLSKIFFFKLTLQLFNQIVYFPIVSNFTHLRNAFVASKKAPWFI